MAGVVEALDGSARSERVAARVALARYPAQVHQRTSLDQPDDDGATGMHSGQVLVADLGEGRGPLGQAHRRVGAEQDVAHGAGQREVTAPRYPG